MLAFRETRLGCVLSGFGVLRTIRRLFGRLCGLVGSPGCVQYIFSRITAEVIRGIMESSSTTAERRPPAGQSNPMEYDHVRCTRHCATTGRELQPGELFYSTLTAEGSKLVRHDYSAEAWQGPPERTVGWWKSHLPAREGQRLHWAPNDVMLDLLEQLADDPAHADMRYVLALLLVRRRVCRLEETEQEADQEESLLLSCPRRETEYRVPVAMPSEERIVEIQEELARLLFAA